MQFFPSFDCTSRKWGKLVSHSTAMLSSIGEEFRSAACKVLKVKIASYKETSGHWFSGGDQDKHQQIPLHLI